MYTKQLIALFEAERQALALMDHPNIAKVLDAGATETGRPCFVMELVKGIPIMRLVVQPQGLRHLAYTPPPWPVQPPHPKEARECEPAWFESRARKSVAAGP